MALSTDLTINVEAGVCQQPFKREFIGFQPGALLISVEDQNIRFWYGGQEPTADSGHLLQVGAFLRFQKTIEIENLKICSTGGVAKVSATVAGT